MTAPFLTPLDAVALRGEGIGAPWTFGWSDKVRFHELDALNHVNNAAYLSWFETLRVAYLETYGISDYVSEGRPVLVLRQCGVDYLAPMHLGERYVLTGRTVEVGRTSWRMEYGVFCDGAPRATGHAVIVMLDPAGTRPTPIPEAIRATMIVRDGARSRV